MRWSYIIQPTWYIIALPFWIHTRVYSTPLPPPSLLSLVWPIMAMATSSLASDDNLDVMYSQPCFVVQIIPLLYSSGIITLKLGKRVQNSTEWFWRIVLVKRYLFTAFHRCGHFCTRRRRWPTVSPFMHFSPLRSSTSQCLRKSRPKLIDQKVASSHKECILICKPLFIRWGLSFTILLCAWRCLWTWKSWLWDAQHGQYDKVQP